MSEGIISRKGKSATVTLLEDRTLTATPSQNESEVYALDPFNQLEIGIKYTEDSGESSNTAQVQLFVSEDGTDFYEYAIALDGSPSNGIVSSTLYSRRFEVEGSPGAPVLRWFPVPTAAKFFKVQASESGVASNFGMLTVIAKVSDSSAFI